MQSLIISCLLAIALWLLPASATAAPMPESLGALPGLSKVFAGETPELGLPNGKLSVCPETPNCVGEQSEIVGVLTIAQP